MKKIMMFNGLRYRLIHVLGGMTHREFKRKYKYLIKTRKEYKNEGFNEGLYAGIEEAFMKFYKYALNLYGLDSNTWCDKMWKFINETKFKSNNQPVLKDYQKETLLEEYKKEHGLK